MEKREPEPAPVTPADWLIGVIDAAIGLVPGARALRRGLEAVERRLLCELKSRLERLDPEERHGADPETGTSLSPGSRGSVAPETPATVLAELLERSIDQTPEEARDRAFVTMLRQLGPDEARILAALSDGGGYPVIHVTAASTLGSSTRQVLSNVSAVGRAAGVQCREMTPRYVSHLLELGVAELAPEDPELAVKYEILESNTQVREAIAKIGSGEKLRKARIVRRTIRLTRLGRDLWAACQPRSFVGAANDRSG